MSIQKADNVQINKCPHGFPVGTCPICNGTMSTKINKDKDKPRVKGEMSYNECLAAWHKIQAMKEAKLKERIERLNQIKEQSRLDRINHKLEILKTSLKNYIEKLNDIQKTLSNLNAPKIVQNALKIAINIIKPIIKIAVIMAVSISFVFNTISSLIKFSLTIAEKLPSLAKEIFTEIKQFIKNGISKAKKALKTLLSLFCQNNEEEQEGNEDNKKHKKIKEIFKKIRKS